MESFFKRKRDEEVAEHTSGPDILAMVVFVNQRDEDGQENHMLILCFLVNLPPLLFSSRSTTVPNHTLQSLTT